MSKKRVECKLNNWSLNTHGNRETLMGAVKDHPRFDDGFFIVTKSLKVFDLEQMVAIDEDDTLYYLGDRYSRDSDTKSVTVTVESTEEKVNISHGKPLC